MSQNINKKTNRNSSIELLRIIAMLMIVFFHFADHGGFIFESRSITLPLLWCNFIGLGGKIGVNVFVLITGYFLINNKEVFNSRKALKFWGQVFFYSVVLFVVAVIMKRESFGIMGMAKALLPITFEKWWFATSYFVLFIFHPFINKLLISLDKKTYKIMLIIMMVCWSLIPTLTTMHLEANTFVWFVFVYAIAGYIRLYGLNPNLKCKHYFLMFIVSGLLLYLSTFALSVVGTKVQAAFNERLYFAKQEKITTLLIALFLFMTFATLEMKYSKWINKIASAMFGVYLLHDSEFLRNYLWTDLFKNATYEESSVLIIYSIGVVILVFVVCTLIDLLRQGTIEKVYLRFVDSIIKKFSGSSNRILTVVMNLVFGKN